MNPAEALAKYNVIDARVGIKPYWEVRDIIDELVTYIEDLESRKCSNCSNIIAKPERVYDCALGYKIPYRPRKEVVEVFTSYPDRWEYVTDTDFCCNRHERIKLND